MSGSGAPSGDRQTVLVVVGASAGQVPVLRTVMADLASRADFDLDTVEDLRLAVDEAASELVGLARPEARLSATFVLTDAELQVTVSVGAREGARVATESFGWRVLSTLADQVDVDIEIDAEGPVLRITLSKKHHEAMRSVDR